MLLESAEAAIRRHAMIPRGGHVLVAVSGGIDSVVLLDVLAHLSASFPFHVAVGHVDHGWRGSTSAEDAAFVESLANEYGVPYRYHRLSDRETRQARSQGREGAARHARLASLRTMATDVSADRIALGHTADDQAETLLFRLTRGTGPKGLVGMRPIRKPFIRPLLSIGRPDILAYAKSRDLSWREDGTNTDLSYARNRLRHRVLPELRAINPEAVDALCRAGDLQADLEEATDFFVRAILSEVRVDEGRADSALRRSCLQALPDSVAELILREALRQARGNLTGIERAHIDAVLALLASDRSHGQLSLPGMTVLIERDHLSFSFDERTSSASWRVDAPLGVTALPEASGELDLRIIQPAEVDLAAIASDPWVEVADADLVRFPLHVRTRKDGDRFAPLGLSNEVKLKEFLSNEHAPYFHRDRIPLLCDAQSILWVVGYRLSDTVRVSDKTERVLLMRLRGPA